MIAKWGKKKRLGFFEKANIPRKAPRNCVFGPKKNGVFLFTWVKGGFFFNFQNNEIFQEN